MPGSYRHIKEYEKEILEMKSQGITLQAIGEQLGPTYKQVHKFITRHNANQRRIKAGIALKCKGRPPKDYVVSEQDKVAKLRYILARKEAKIQPFISCQKKEISQIWRTPTSLS